MKNSLPIEFENDWAKLREAASHFQDQLENFWFIHSPECNASEEDLNYLTALIRLTPKLLDSYAELWELMEHTLSAMEQQKLGPLVRTESGIVVPA